MQKIPRALMAMLVALITLASPICYGLDTDLYVLSGKDIPPNVLVILDSSASMDEVVSGSDADYSKDIDYGALLTPPSVVYPQYAVYYKTAGGKWSLWIKDYHSLSDPCFSLLGTYGHTENNDCGGGKRDYQTGNYRNFLQISGPGGSRSRFGLANGVIHSYVDTVQGVRFGVMAFNRDSLGNVVKYDSAGIYKEYVTGGGDPKDDPFTTPGTPWDAAGGQVLGFVDELKNGKTSLFGKLASLKNDSWSPLAETLTDAGIYMQTGKDALGNPIVQYPCQKLYILIISDGFPTKDTGKLDDVAKSLFNLDLTNGTYHTPQNIKVYTIGFSVDDALLKETARVGGGKYSYVYSSQSFNIAFQNLIADVLDESTSYVAPVVPISQMETFRSSDRMFLAMFKPTWTSFWRGNIKKYGIYTNDPDNSCYSPSFKTGDILDSKCKLAINSKNQIFDIHNDPADPYSAISYWSSEANPDGREVDRGGVGEKLQNRDLTNDPRHIYTYLGTNANLTDLSNAFTKDNPAITPTALGYPSDDVTSKEKIIKFIHGWDPYDENRNNVVDEKRDWILGAFIHSRPVAIHYGSKSVVYAGANDGMLHAFDNGKPISSESWDDGTGEELWAFIPPKLLPNLQKLNGEALEFFVDGSPKAYTERDASGKLTKAILIFGMRRGGNFYIALDVTDYSNPKWLWEISPSTPGYEELGQSWSTPNLGRINDGSVLGKAVAFIGGGYDENQDLASPLNDTKGRAIYVVDISDGSLVWSYSYAKNTNMKYCIPSDVARVDTSGDGIVDRLYVGDTGGQMWRFDIQDVSPSNWTGKVLFDSNPGLSLKRKIFYPPDVTLEKGNYEIIFFGTGDREHPKDTTKENRLYAIKDKNPPSFLTESSLVDVTLDSLQDPDLSQNQKDIIVNSLNTQSGWFIKLNQNPGEKSLANPLIFYGVVYFTTFVPDLKPADICYMSAGSGRIYALKYTTGNAVFNLDLTNDAGGTVIGRSDRSALAGVSIPSGVIVTFVGGTSVAYAGVGGGVYTPPLPTHKVIIPINWRIAF